jgi:hypothetical protein
MFKKSLLVYSFIFLFFSCASKKQSITENDWYAFTKNSSERQTPSKIYAFTDGMVRMYGDNIGYLMTHKSYKNFELSLDYKWNMDDNLPKTKGKKNSGVMYNIPVESPDNIWPKGIQFQIKDESTGDFIFLDNITAKVNGKFIEGGRSVNSFKFIENEKPYGEWNTVLIRSFNGKLTQYLNGKLVNECTEVSSREGKISLNYEGAPIDFRNIQIKNIRKE